VNDRDRLRYFFTHSESERYLKWKSRLAQHAEQRLRTFATVLPEFRARAAVVESDDSVQSFNGSMQELSRFLLRTED
jgi:hypothetical protein